MKIYLFHGVLHLSSYLLEGLPTSNHGILSLNASQHLCNAEKSRKFAAHVHLLEKLLASPIFVAVVASVFTSHTGTHHDSLSVRHVSPHDQGYLLLSQLLDSNLQRIGFSFQVNKNWRIHARYRSQYNFHISMSVCPLQESPT